jgi:hypothetical protein
MGTVRPQAQQAAFEAALDVLSSLIGLASTRIRELEAHPGPDAELIRRWRSRRDEWANRHRTLRADDVAAVRAVLDTDAATLRRESA